jgi:hypothetical protein
MNILRSVSIGSNCASPPTRSDPIFPPLDYVGLADLTGLALSFDDEARLAASAYHTALDGGPCWAVEALPAILDALK